MVQPDAYVTPKICEQMWDNLIIYLSDMAFHLCQKSFDWFVQYLCPSTVLAQT